MHGVSDLTYETNNRLLSVLPRDEFEFIHPHLEPASLKLGTTLAQLGDSLETCFFPNNGMISLLSVTEYGTACEVGYVGFEGMIGLSPLLGKNEMPYQALVQANCTGTLARTAVVEQLFKKGGVFHDAVLRFTYVVLRQVAQTCTCNHFHNLHSRLCRWLSVMSERSGDKNLALTQEFLAHMLGVQRTSLGLIANSMQKDGLIRYRRGKIEIVDFERLRSSACECFHIVKREYQEFLDDKKFQPMSDARQTSGPH
jgi:CRP-like cAMP-binding protein